ncbi:metallophosphoesterase [Deinococcus aerophilus]|uniref:Metallophosphoesterase n=1 Tax=Deinococcus aerophilus TaxID=522488 RepID=A0ABQ2GWP6_9DEIO|nr:metallophosphoesterase [Deinococcus aerophilus]GGM15769.1 putative metallophosphoesterase [Deinococcus aerophilus]
MAFSPSPHFTRRGVLRGLLGGGLGVAALGGLGVAQAYRFEVTFRRPPLGGLTRPLRVAFLTDLHYGLFIGPGSVRTWVDAATALRPDLIVLGGDQLDRRAAGPPSELLAELGRLRAPLGVFGVWGNHDCDNFGQASRLSRSRPGWAARREALRQAYLQAGITILRNEGRAVRDDVYLGGVDDLIHGTPDVAAALAGAGKRATVLVSHNPDLLPKLPQHVGLVLSGHTHGGQIRVPLLGAPVVPSRYGQRYAMGWVMGAHDTPGYVSRGLGLSGVPLRNLCAPELTLLTLTPAQT